MGRQWIDSEIRRNGGYHPVAKKWANHDYAVGLLYCSHIEREYEACLNDRKISSNLSQEEFYKLYDKENKPNIWQKMSKEYKQAYSNYLQGTSPNRALLSKIFTQYSHATQERYIQDGTTLHGRFQPMQVVNGKETNFQDQIKKTHAKNIELLNRSLSAILQPPYAEYNTKEIADLRKQIADLEAIFKKHEKSLDFLKQLEKDGKVWSDTMPEPIKLDYQTPEGVYQGAYTTAICPPETVLEAEQKIAGTFPTVQQQLNQNKEAKKNIDPKLVERRKAISEQITAIRNCKDFKALTMSWKIEGNDLTQALNKYYGEASAQAIQNMTAGIKQSGQLPDAIKKISGNLARNIAK